MILNYIWYALTRTNREFSNLTICSLLSAFIQWHFFIWWLNQAVNFVHESNHCGNVRHLSVFALVWIVFRASNCSFCQTFKYNWPELSTGSCCKIWMTEKSSSDLWVAKRLLYQGDWRYFENYSTVYNARFTLCWRNLNGGFTLKNTNVFRPHYAKEI